VLSADERPLTPTTCATRNPAGWALRSAMSSQCHYAPLTIITYTTLQKNENGGWSERSIRSSSPGLYGNEAKSACLTQLWLSRLKTI
jgi:hypothetical protein